MPDSDKPRLGRRRPKPPLPAEPPAGANGFQRWWFRRRKKHAAKKARLMAMSRKRRYARRTGIIATWVLGFIAIVMVVAVIGFYKFSNVPSPEDVALPQVARIEYADGSTMARIGDVDRIVVPLSKVPVQVRWDVLAAEDRNFYNEPGISIKGTLRAALSDLTGGDTQGGSGITQQYVKNAYLNDSRTLTRKLRELAIAVKLSREFSKDQILGFYLNTVYFGRGAYGIQAAAHAFFGEDVSKLTVAQGAVLAAQLRAPSYYDPAVHPGQARSRWQYVIDGMVQIKRLTQSQADALTYPTTKKPTTARLGLTGPRNLIVQQVIAELEDHGVSSHEIQYGGLTIRTTIQRNAEKDALTAIHEAYGHPTSKQKNLKQALVAVNPKTGGVIAYFGGRNGTGLDYAQTWRQPGSSFKPYVLAAALEQTLNHKSGDSTPTYTINSVFNGKSPQLVDGFEIHNDPTDPSSGMYSLKQAMTLSLNTVFYKLASLVGPDNVANVAHALGIPEKETDTGPNPGAKTLQDADGHVGDKIGIGGYEVRPIDQADAYAALADNGIAHSAYFVQQAKDASGNIVYQHTDDHHQAIDPKVANDVTLSMEDVASTSGIALDGGRPVAAKTGTVAIANSLNSSDAWTVGFTPQVAVASWAGSNGTGPIYDDNGNSMYGRENPGQAWQLFLNAYLANKPVEQLATTQEVLGGTDQASSSTRASTSATKSASTSKSTSPSPTFSVSTGFPSPSTTPPTSTSSTPTPPPTTSPVAPSSSTQSCGGLLQSSCSSSAGP